jgi:hypothetical protein
MTAQIGILNKKAIVLATDSAVTIRTSKNEEKVFNSVNKLFSLSKVKPIGVMIYGNAELLGTPWETIIKVYRKQLTSDFKTLKEYANDLIHWLENNSKALFSKKIQEHYFYSSIQSFYYGQIVTPIEGIAESTIKEKKKLEEKEIAQLLKQHIEDILKNLKSRDFINNFDEKFTSDLIKSKKKKIQEIIDNIFDKRFLTKGLEEKLLQISGYIFTKDVFQDSYSGLVVAGFGDDDIFPSLYEFDIEGVFCNRLKYKVLNETEIKADGHTASIMPFAQDDVIKNFISGIHPFMLKFLEDLFPLYSQKIIEEINGNNELKKKLDKINKHLFQVCINETKKYSDPIIDMVSLMPITEMCHFAESLVNLTSLRKKITMQTETVGGQTEVVSITKGEGLIWIKRKHYFEPHLNPGFSQNYLEI